jgi:hypothetical protein
MPYLSIREDQQDLSSLSCHFCHHDQEGQVL